MSIKSRMNHQGGVEIAFDSNTDFLAAPDGKKYLPCTACTKLQAVEMNVVSLFCDPCGALMDKGELAFCDDCKHYVKPVPFDDTKDQCRWVPSFCDEDGTGFETVRTGYVGDKCPCCNEILHCDFID